MNSASVKAHLDARTVQGMLRGHSAAVIDANLTVDAAAVVGPRHDLARDFMLICQHLSIQLFAPAFWALEADTALRQMFLRGLIPPAHLPAAYAALDSLPVTLIYDSVELSAARQSARVIAQNLNQPSVYDAHYAAIAQARGVPFWTVDQRFANAARQLRRQPDGSMTPALPGVFCLLDYGISGQAP